MPDPDGLNPDSDTDDTAPVAEGTVDSLVAGQARLEALIGAADDAAGDNTVIGQLKQIVENTTPTP